MHKSNMCKMGEKGLKILTCEKNGKHKFIVCPKNFKIDKIISINTYTHRVCLGNNIFTQHWPKLVPKIQDLHCDSQLSN
jgi:hypothetical protein